MGSFEHGQGHSLGGNSMELLNQSIGTIMCAHAKQIWEILALLTSALHGKHHNEVSEAEIPSLQLPSLDTAVV